MASDSSYDSYVVQNPSTRSGWSSPEGTADYPSLMPTSHLDMAFRYALSVPQVTCAVIGMATPNELQENLQRARTFSPLNSREVPQLMKFGRSLASQWGTHFGSLV
jgi:predicted aldo/keto reductase-like oxidoreductase